jgi:Arc/MetJ-type ribon-helix-helix transcriptional regulator
MLMVMPKQIAVKIPEQMLEAVDGLVAAGRYSSRSSAVRAGLTLVVRQADREEVDRAFADGFRRRSETPQELDDARRLAIEAIEDEPWEPWW